MTGAEERGIRRKSETTSEVGLRVPDAEWGSKHTCTDCGTKFYDLGRKPVTCPKCNTVVEIQIPRATRRSRSPQVQAVPVKKPVVEAESSTVAEEGDTGLDITDESDDREAGRLIEDTAEFGGENDMSEVIGGIDPKAPDS